MITTSHTIGVSQQKQRKKLLNGFLAGRERVQDEAEKASVQGRLWE